MRPQGEAGQGRASAAVLAALWGQTVISAGTHLAARRATQDIDPMTVATLRLLASGLLFALVIVALGERRLPPKKEWAFIAFFSLLAGPVNQGLFLYGLSRSLASHGALLYALTPVGVYLVSVVRGRERLNPARVGGIALAFSGVLVLLVGRGLDAALGPLWGDLFILGAVVAWIAWTVESKPFATRHGALRTTAWSLALAGLWMVPLIPFTVTPEAVARATPGAWASLGYLVFLTSVLAYGLWNYALARIDASRVAVFANLQPVLTAVAAFFLLDEPIGWPFMVGGVLVLLGVRLAQWRPAAQTAPATSATRR